jgi:hypothetical protein
MQAKATRSELTIWVAYPESLSKQILEEEEELKEIKSQKPHLAVGPWVDSFKPVYMFINDLDAKVVRSEFQRKAKKLDLKFREEIFPFSIHAELRGLRLQATAYSK